MKDFKMPIELSDRITRTTDVTTRYFNDVSKINQITPDTELILAKKAFNGNSEARDELVNANLRFVITVAKAYHGGNDCRFEDLISEGNLGLIEAANTFDPNMGVKFISHAIWHIRKNIFKYLTDNVRQIRLPNSINKSVHQMKKLEAKLMQELGRDPLKEEIITSFIEECQTNKGVTPRRINLEHAFNADISAYPIDSPVPGTESLTLLDTIDSKTDLSDYLLDSYELSTKQIITYVNTLRYKEIEILRMRFGLDGNEPLTISEIAEIYKIGNEAVRIRLKTAIRNIKWKLVRGKVSVDSFL